jgi:hypothetical protein
VSRNRVENVFKMRVCTCFFDSPQWHNPHHTQHIGFVALKHGCFVYLTPVLYTYIYLAIQVALPLRLPTPHLNLSCLSSLMLCTHMVGD